jgi:CRP-like cAMP-binding protein
VLGLPSALCAKSYQFDVEAVEAVEAVYLPTESVNEILRQKPELGMQAMSMMCDELSALRQTTDHMRSCGQRSCSLHGSCTHASHSL